MSVVSAWFRVRAPLLGVVATGVLVFLAVAMSRPTAASWGSLLAPHGVVEVGEIRWVTPAGPGTWGTALAEGTVAAQGPTAASTHREILLFDAMTSGSGGPYQVRRVGNLTNTPHADDSLLGTRLVDGQLLVASAAVIDGNMATVQLFDLAGDPQVQVDEAGNPRDAGARHLQAGVANPRSTTGLRGTGKVPRNPDVLRRLVLGFNGGFRTSHGAYGMILDRNVFVPPKPAMATIAFYDDGGVRMGTWPGAAPMGNYRREHAWQIKVSKADEAAPVPAAVRSLRQNLPPLVSQGRLNPGGARRWGGPVAYLNHTSTPRSGVCVAPPDTLVYVWGKRCAASDLGSAMILAGCSYGVHLDMNPYHTGIAMYHVPVQDGVIPPDDAEDGPKGTLAEAPTKAMSFKKHRYVAREVKDFFYVTRRRRMQDRLALPVGFTPWSATGLPMARGGVADIALCSQSGENIRLLALDGRAFAVFSSPAELPAGTRGSLHLDIHFTTRLHGGATLGTSQDGAVTILNEQRTGVPGKLLAVDVVPDGLRELRDPVILGINSSGDLVLLFCRGCHLDRALEVLAIVDLPQALLLGAGQVALSSHTGAAWRGVAGELSPKTPSLHIRLVPKPSVPAVSVVDFAGPGRP